MNSQTLTLAPEAKPAPRPVRRTQGERSAETRRKILSSSVELLHQIGYAGATTSQIAKAAGVSLGALQHQYPTKAGLMAAVVRRFATERFLAYRRALRGVPEGLPRFLALSKASWSLIGSKELVAAMEIELAMRDDRELADAIGDTLSRHSAFVRRLLARILEGVIRADDPRVETVRLLNNAIMFGLTLETIRTVSPAQIKQALAAWEHAMVGLLTAA
ncbi:MAG: TetR/AcrR family transcriptional regulator [Novosphingobium sp.]|nr:TetR/AcrR family transcriptional regulator [Novosphingobium sp.]